MDWFKQDRDTIRKYDSIMNARPEERKKKKYKPPQKWEALLEKQKSMNEESKVNTLLDDTEYRGGR